MSAAKRIQIISQCTNSKRGSNPDQLTKADFYSSEKELRKRMAEQQKYMHMARGLYTGDQHVRVMRGVDRINGRPRGVQAHVRIVSAGFGLVEADDYLHPYNCTFSGMQKKEIRRHGDYLDIPEDVKDALEEEGWALHIVILGREYLLGADLKRTMPELSAPTILFCTESAPERDLKIPNLTCVPLIKDVHCGEFGCGSIGLKGAVVEQMLFRLDGDLTRLEQYIKSPATILEQLKPKRKGLGLV